MLTAIRSHPILRLAAEMSDAVVGAPLAMVGSRGLHSRAKPPRVTLRPLPVMPPTLTPLAPTNGTLVGTFQRSAATRVSSEWPRAHEKPGADRRRVRRPARQ